MSALGSITIVLNKLDKSKIFTTEKGDKLYTFNLGINDETKFGNNVSAWNFQSKEAREAKASREYVGNGRILWTDGNIVVAEKEETNKTTPLAKVESDDLPF